jgi:SAM-dependent methyltransferase
VEPTYGTSFYEAIAADSQQSAEVVVPLVNDLVKPLSVLDVGCGTGEWLKVWSNLGITDFLGVDGSYVDRALLSIPPDHFRGADLANGLDLGRRFDLVTSLEVAEHLPPESADRFVATLTAHSDVVLFSAAIPGQGGNEHVNERWPRYWIERFSSRGYEALDVLRPSLWGDDRVAFWYRQNALLFAHRERVDGLIDRCDGLASFHGQPMIQEALYLSYKDRTMGFSELLRELPPAFRAAVCRRI